MALAVAFATVLAACAAPAGPGAGDGFAGFPSCDDIPMIAADDALYRDEPTYGNATELVDAVRAWAQGQDGFEELWLDRERHGWITVGFRGGDVAALQEEAAAEFPGEGVVIVDLPHTLTELVSLLDRVLPALDAANAPPVGMSPDVTRGLLALSGVPATADAEAALREFAGEPICVSTTDPGAIVPEGPQPTEGDGWRLLGHAQGVGEAYRTGVASTDTQLTALWTTSGLDGEAPAVDWDAEVVVWFGAVYGSSCPVRLDDVVVEGATVHADLVVPGSGPDSACTADDNPHSFVVAVERSALPVGPFQVQLGASDPPVGAPLERTLVDVDLSAPGATAPDAAVGADPGTSG